MCKWPFIPYHRFISGNEVHTDETKVRQEDGESVQRKKDRSTENTKHRKDKREFSLRTVARTLQCRREETTTTIRCDCNVQASVNIYAKKRSTKSNIEKEIQGHLDSSIDSSGRRPVGY